MSKDNEIEEVFKWIEEDFGGVDVLVNNAAVLIGKPIHGKKKMFPKFIYVRKHTATCLFHKKLCPFQSKPRKKSNF